MNNKIKIKQNSSSLSEFVQRPIASDEEVEAFDEYAENEAKEEEIKNSLIKIYQDDQGNRVDVKKMIIKAKRGLLFNLFTFLIVLFVFGGAIYGAYNYIYLKIINNKATVTLEFNANKEVVAGEEFYYDLNYKNEDNVDMTKIEIKITYPDNFIFLNSEPEPSRNNNIWEITSLDAHRSDVIRIKGKLAGPSDSSNIILADIIYTPKNFSSEFKKSTSLETKINDIGLDFSFNNSSGALINETNEIAVKFKAKTESYISNLRLNVEHPEEAEIISLELANQDNASSSAVKAGAPAGLIVQSSGPDIWFLSNFGKNENEFKIKFKIKEKKQPNINLKLKFELPEQTLNLPPKYHLFYEKDLVYDVIKSDLNINLIINGSPFDQGVDFGQTLNYSINYANKGDTAMKDVIIMAILESDFINWQTLNDQNNGKISGNTISWSKQEIPALAELPSGAEAVMDFSLKLKTQAEIDLSKTYQVKSYVQYSIESKNVSLDNQSNAVINKINSDLNLSEQVRYFNDDNIAVGSGPLPPKVGQATSLKVYWAINNNLHELNDLRISVTLPANIAWDNKNRASVGSLDYDSQTNQVVWQIGRLPVTVFKADAEFNISISPGESDRNKIMIILPGTNVAAIDSETNTQINKTLKAKNTMLEDDNMASGDGIIQ
ncbi:hypothetical protein KKA93_01880 [Patescibacteria group bacterium]|nr:hypothetical protein [Patescibacteria group bacterium]MBU1663064.1 hypothetical protein [Patescibacteria group bacterium]MBU1934008.1 hypothetical protein [Patescibacteria group bacterium]MBU2007873.1 hypothetical protein [Patescibacteria group bacterium]MBU2233481.1 hypothetical protein [Patescibacteria group bacterium]